MRPGTDKVGYEDMADDDEDEEEEVIEEVCPVKRKSLDTGGGRNKNPRLPLQARRLSGVGSKVPYTTNTTHPVDCKENRPFTLPTTPKMPAPATSVSPSSDDGVLSREINNNKTTTPTTIPRHKDTYNEPLNVNVTDTYMDTVPPCSQMKDSPQGGDSDSDDVTKRGHSVPPKKRWFPRTLEYQGQILVTDITHNCVTVTFLESPTEKGFFKEHCS